MRQTTGAMMQLCHCLLFSCLLASALLHSAIGGLGVQRHPGQHVDRPLWRSSAGLRHHHGGPKAGEELTEKLLQLDDLTRTENDVMEPKRKRSFPSNGAPLDRLSVSSMETKQGTTKQSKVAEAPRRRVNPPPIDRIGVSRLPNRG
ncbi:osteocrin [Pholidichthys leucotaenia]